MASKELAKFPGGLQGLDWPGARGFYPTIGWPSFFKIMLGTIKIIKHQDCVNCPNDGYQHYQQNYDSHRALEMANFRIPFFSRSQSVLGGPSLSGGMQSSKAPANGKEVSGRAMRGPEMEQTCRLGTPKIHQW